MEQELYHVTLSGVKRKTWSHRTQLKDWYLEAELKQTNVKDMVTFFFLN